MSLIIDTIYESSSLMNTLKQYSLLRDKAVNAVCQICAQQTKKDPSFVESVFNGKLFRPLTIAHQKYTKHMGISGIITR